MGKKATADYHTYFVATYNDSDNGESYLLRLKPRKDGTIRNVTDVYNVVTGENEVTDKIATNVIKLAMFNLLLKLL